MVKTTNIDKRIDERIAIAEARVLKLKAKRKAKILELKVKRKAKILELKRKAKKPRHLKRKISNPLNFRSRKLEGEVCRAEINKNIVLVETGGVLTLPLSVLNKNCKFNQAWDKAYNIWHPEEVKKEIEEKKEERKRKAKEYNMRYQSKPEARAKRIAKYQLVKGKIAERMKSPENRARLRVYFQRPDVIAKRKLAYEKRKNDQRPEALARKLKKKLLKEEYNRRPDVIAKRLETRKAYLQRPEVRARLNIKSRKYYHKIKSNPVFLRKLKEKHREYYKKIKENPELLNEFKEKGRAYYNKVRKEVRIKQKEYYNKTKAVQNEIDDLIQIAASVDNRISKIPNRKV